MESPRTLAPPVSIPNPYYAKVDPWLDHSIFGVESLIGSGILRRYDTRVFDCSEMAAYLEWMLEKHGFDTKICLADNFANDYVGHAWVAVDIPPRRYYVEPTAVNPGGFIFSTIKPYDGNYKDYADTTGYMTIYMKLRKIIPSLSLTGGTILNWHTNSRSLKEEIKWENGLQQFYRY